MDKLITITETTAIRLFSSQYVGIIDSGTTEKWNGMVGNEFEIKALVDVWLNLSEDGQQELIAWANKYYEDDDFNTIVAYAENLRR